jgi:ribosome-associated translation inhibitor RaiA
MQVRWVFNRCEGQKERAKSYWEEKQPRLERLLTRYQRDQQNLRLTLYRRSDRDVWELRAVLHLPTGTLLATSAHDTLSEVIDTVLDELAGEIKRHNERLQKHCHYRRRRRRREKWEAQEHVTLGLSHVMAG